MSAVDLLARPREPRAMFNIAACLPENAAKAPDRIAVWTARTRGPFTSLAWKATSYAELNARADAIAHGLSARGLARGDRAAIFVRPGADLVATVFALFKLGAVPVVMDPGMGTRALVSCLAKMRPRAFIGVPAAQALRMLHKSELDSIEIAVTAGPRWLGTGDTLSQLAAHSSARVEIAPTSADDEAAILFTSGSTGPPKGVVYTHANFAAQVEALRVLYALEPGEIDLACFPLFALFDVALEMTSVFPPIDPARPGECDPAAIAASIERHCPTNTFGSPAIWRRVVPHCAARGLALPSLKRILIAGAPVPPALVESLRDLMHPSADVHTPYGATECLPVTSISGAEILGPLRARAEEGAGTCVGRAAPGVRIALIAIQDEPIAEWRDAARVGDGALGEICVQGDVVTREYKLDAEHTALAKVRDGAAFWHRTGDVGYVDRDGLLWFCGRKAHRIRTAEGLAMPVPLENMFDLHPRVRRTAVVGVGAPGSERATLPERERAILIVEPLPEHRPRTVSQRRDFARDILALGRTRAGGSCAPLLPPVDRVLFHERFPVDARHNAKIQREKLRTWAAEQAT